MVKADAGYIMKPIGELIKIETKENATKLYFKEMSAELSLPLSQIEKRLPEAIFFRKCYSGHEFFWPPLSSIILNFFRV